MKTIIQIVLWIACAGLAYLIYQSVTGPIQFAEVKQERYGKVINTLKDIRSSQEAYKTVKGRYAKDFKTLVAFVDNGNYTITQQRDTSFTVYDKRLQIDVPKDSIIIDTLGTRAVKDSIFGKDDRYKNMMNVPGAPGKTFTMKADIVDKGGYKAPVFEAKVAKIEILGDQPDDLVKQEKSAISVEEVNGEYISVGSLNQVSTAGNWPPIYDRKKD